MLSQVLKVDMQDQWMQSRDYKEVGLRELAILNEGLRYSPPLCESIGTGKPVILKLPK